MALTLSKVLQRVWRELGWSIDIYATGGTTTTVVDANTVYTSDNALQGGTAIVVRDAGGASAAPEGEFGVISAFVASTKTFTIGAVSTAIAANDSLQLANAKLRLPQAIQAVNDGLSNLGTISLVDTSLSTVAAQREYNLPVGLKIKTLRDVLIQTKLNDTDDNRFQSIITNVRFFPAAPGTVGIIETLGDYPAGRTIKIVYEGVHPTLASYSDKVSETIQEELAAAAAIDKALTWYVSKHGDSALGTFILQRWNDAKQTLQAQKADKPIYHAKSKTKWFSAGIRVPPEYNPNPGDHWTS